MFSYLSDLSDNYSERKSIFFPKKTLTFLLLYELHKKYSILVEKSGKGDEIEEKLSTISKTESAKIQVIHEVVHIIHKKEIFLWGFYFKKSNVCFVKMDKNGFFAKKIWKMT